MADRIFDLTDNPSPTGSERIIIDDPSFSEAQSVTIDNLLAGVYVDFEAADTLIISGTGLNSDGSFSPFVASNYLKSTDFSGAALDVNERNALSLLDTAIGNIESGNEQTTQIDLSSAEILALGTALTKIAKPGAGLVLHYFECDAAVFFGTTPYVSAGSNGIDVIFQGGSDQIVRLPKVFLEASANSAKKFLIASHELLTDTAVQVIAPDGNPTGGDGTISIRLRGIIDSALAFGGSITTNNCCVQPLSGTFTNADLTALGNLEIYHGFNTDKTWVLIKDNTGATVAVVDTAGKEDTTNPYNYRTVAIGLGITGTWSYQILIQQ